MLKNPFKRKPKIVSLYKWNKNRSQAFCTAETFDDLFAGKLVAHDADEDFIFASLQIGEQIIIVIRDKTN